MVVFVPKTIATWKAHANGRTIFDVTNVFGQSCVLQLYGGIPERLYRYTSRRNLDDLIQNGRVRLGTLFGYLKDERMNDAQRDANEGLALFPYDVFRFADAPIAFAVTSLDRWVLCLSDKLSRELMSKFEADAVACICGEGFYVELARSMALRAEIGSLDKVTYVENVLSNDWNVSEDRAFAHMRKGVKYAYQSEWRLNFEKRGAFKKSTARNAELSRFELKKPNDVDWLSRSRTNGNSGEVLDPVFVTNKHLRQYVTDVTHLAA